MWNNWRKQENHGPQDLAERTLVNRDLRGANLTFVDLAHSDLTAVDLRGANLELAKLDRADLTGANARDATLSHVSLRSSICVNTDLRHSILVGANSEGADLTGASIYERGSGFRFRLRVWRAGKVAAPMALAPAAIPAMPIMDLLGMLIGLF